MTNQLTYQGEVRKWQGTLEQWAKHEEVIVHWCDGGEVEKRAEGEWWAQYSPRIKFECHREYRIKQRKPKVGEVWTREDDGHAYIVTDGGIVSLDAGIRYTLYEDSSIEYAAPSVDEYYLKVSAKHFWDKAGADTRTDQEFKDELEFEVSQHLEK